MRNGAITKEKQAERLREARLAAGFENPQSALDKFQPRYGWKSSTYFAHENGQNGIRPDAATEYAKAYDVDAGWILTGEGRGPKGGGKKRVASLRPEIMDIRGTEFASIGRYDVRLSAGPGSIIDPHAEPMGFHLMERQWLRAVSQAAPEQLAIVRVAGDSMLPTLADGDWVLIDRTQQSFAREGIYAIRVLDQAWVKRLSLNLREKLIRIISDNPVVPMQEEEEENLTIIGKVVALVARRVP